MDIKIILTESLLNLIFDQESKKIVGKCMKRFELTDDKELIKKEVKELLYECLRDIKDMLLLNKESIKLTKKE
jgi:hypothetical protein